MYVQPNILDFFETEVTFSLSFVLPLSSFIDRIIFLGERKLIKQPINHYVNLNWPAS